MAEKVIKNNQSLVPFFGERLSFIRGLDPLGLQNTSDLTFSMLLPGLNNVTGRIRYYSFYCWLLDKYSKISGSTNPEDQKRFIRRAEYIIALASQYFEGENSNIPGSNYSYREIEIKGNTNHDLQAGTFKADGSTAETYWNYPFGAFGQYYLGSLRDIEIIIDREKQAGTYVRTNTREDQFVSGEMLAAAFDTNISPEVKDLFISSIASGHIEEEQLKSLLPDLDLTKVPPKSDEADLLLKLLLQKDYPLRIEEDPSTLRNQTLLHLLKFLGSNPPEFSDRTFVYFAYDKKGKVNGLSDPCLFGWYYYQFNEFWHFANTSIFNGTLAFLHDTKGPNWIPIHQLISDIVNKVIEDLISMKRITTDDETLGTLLENLIPDEYAYFDATSKSSDISKITNGFLILFSQYLNNYNELISLKEYAENNDLGKDGEGSAYYITQFPAKKDFNLHQFFTEYIIQNIVYRHQYVAFRKIGGGSLSTQKFIIEDHHIRYLGNYVATYTGPRIGNLIRYLHDLEIISPHNALTDAGSSLINDKISTDD